MPRYNNSNKRTLASIPEEKTITTAKIKGSTEITTETNVEQEQQFHHRCSGCNKCINQKLFDARGTCNACYISDNKVNVRRRIAKNNTNKRNRARAFKTTYSFC